jgi:hypothetical protein
MPNHVPWFIVHCIVVYLPFPVPIPINISTSQELKTSDFQFESHQISSNLAVIVDRFLGTFVSSSGQRSRACMSVHARAEIS